MREYNEVKRVCGFYVSNIHFVTMILPYLNKQIGNRIKIDTFFEYDLSKNIKTVLEKINLNEIEKQEIKKINWKNTKKSDIEKNIETNVNNKSELIILINGNENYMEEINEKIDKYLEDNNINNKSITIINCYEVSETNNVKEIIDKHKYLINTLGIKKIEEVFGGYSKIAN